MGEHRTDDPRVQRIVEFFEHLTRADLARLAEIYRDDAAFKDPFNEVRGAAAIARIFEHMFDTLEGPRFVVHDAVVEGAQCFLTWDFVFVRGGGELVVRGASHLRFADDGRIAVHRDYWDAAEELYEKLPLLGGVMRWLKRRISAA
jgi:ketosteroid isomerase-like protein